MGAFCASDNVLCLDLGAGRIDAYIYVHKLTKMYMLYFNKCLKIFSKHLFDLRFSLLLSSSFFENYMNDKLIHQ